MHYKTYSAFSYGGDSEARTHNPFGANEMLSQLELYPHMVGVERIELPLEL